MATTQPTPHLAPNPADGLAAYVVTVHRRYKPRDGGQPITRPAMFRMDAETPDHAQAIAMMRFRDIFPDGRVTRIECEKVGE